LILVEKCKHTGCDRPKYRLGYCGAHRARFMQGRDMDAPWAWEITPQERFWAKVDKTDECWIWTGSKDRKGYGKANGGLAHRFSYEFAHGPIPGGMFVDHICHNPACVNPDHLRLADAAQNSQNRKSATSRSKSGVRGVYWSAREKGWRADASKDGKRHYLGIYPTMAQAEAVVVKWRRENMPFSEMDKVKEN